MTSEQLQEYRAWQAEFIKEHAFRGKSELASLLGEDERMITLLARRTKTKLQKKRAPHLAHLGSVIRANTDKNAVEISKIVGCHHDTVVRYANENNLTLKKRVFKSLTVPESARVEYIKANRGKSPAEMVADLGISRSSLQRTFVKYDIWPLSSKNMTDEQRSEINAQQSNELLSMRWA